MSQASTVLIVDDHKLFADVIRSVLEENGMNVVRIATSARDALTHVREDRPDIVLLDIGLPDGDGITVGRQILEQGSCARVVAVSSHGDQRIVGQAARAGFHGYLTKDMPLFRFMARVAAACNGDTVFPASPQRYGGGTARESAATLRLAELSPREQDVLDLLVQGLGTDDVARSLSVSRNTVRSHIQRILTKLHVHSRLEAVAFAERHRSTIRRPHIHASGVREIRSQQQDGVARPA